MEGVMTTVQDDSMRTLRELVDYEEIRGLLARLGDWLDGQGGDPAEIYEPDITAHSPRGEIQGLAEVIERVAPSGEERSQHFHTDVVVDVDGDTALVRANQFVQVFRPGETPHRTAGGRAAYRLTRREKGWRIAHLDMTLEWIIGKLPT
jgi:ketosteroid isomerase-like protein